ncbi:MAG: hypothetical protein Q9162_002023 [Coniocarpon cinnabarinum]
MASNQQDLSPPPGDAISSVAFHPTNPDHLLVTSWDRYLYHYDLTASSGSQLQSRVEHRAPILSCAWHSSDSPPTAYTVGLDYDVRAVNLSTSEQVLLSTHDAPSAQVVYDQATNALISASWDCTLHIHQPSRDNPSNVSAAAVATLKLPAKPFALALSPTNLIVAMSTRVVYIYSLKSLAALCAEPQSDGALTTEPLQSRESALKFMTRAVAAMPNDAGFACSSIEGRVAVEWFDPSEEMQKKKYAFKCHRTKSKQRDPETGQDEDVDMVYPVHALAFHPVHGTFASGGGDGTVALWDAGAKRRLRQYQSLGSSIAAMAFSCDGRHLAIGASPGFESGDEGEALHEGEVRVVVREIGEKEAMAKASK